MKDFVVNKSKLSETKLMTREPEAVPKGFARLQIERFALTANNITYGVAGDLIGYWKFFPTVEGWGKIPVWGIATVVESNEAGILEGERFYGYFPMSSDLVVKPDRVSPRGFTDSSAHRSELPIVYNQYSRVTPQNGFAPAFDNHKMVYVPLFTTSFVLDDYFSDNLDFGADTLIIGSASSKTAFGMAYMLKRSGRLRTTGLTSRTNADFVSGLDLYDEVKTYEEIESIDRNQKTAYVDMSGNSEVLARIHNHFSENLLASCAVGITHWKSRDAEKTSALPGAKPSMFFAPTQIVKRNQEWGPENYQAKLAEATSNFFSDVDQWVTIEEKPFEQVADVFQTVLNGAPANKAFVVVV